MAHSWTLLFEGLSLCQLQKGNPKQHCIPRSTFYIQRQWAHKISSVSFVIEPSQLSLVQHHQRSKFYIRTQRRRVTYAIPVSNTITATTPAKTNQCSTSPSLTMVAQFPTLVILTSLFAISFAVTIFIVSVLVARIVVDSVQVAHLMLSVTILAAISFALSWQLIGFLESFGLLRFLIMVLGR